MRTFILLLSLILIADSLQAQKAILPPNAEYVAGEFFVKIRPEYKAACKSTEIQLVSIQNIVQKYGLSDIQRSFPYVQAPKEGAECIDGAKMVDLTTLYTIHYPLTTNIEPILRDLLVQKEVLYAEPRYIHHPFFIPNDPYLVDTSGYYPLWHLGQIHAFQAWDIEKGDTNIVIGIADTGTETMHPDLIDNYYKNYADPIDGLDNDNDGYVDNFSGWDAAGMTGQIPDNNPQWSSDQHGVAVGGVACATPNNSIGMAGTGYNCRQMAIKTTPDNGGGITHGYDAIIYAAEHGAHVVNCSWGSPVRSFVGEDVINYATINKGVAVVIACGNSQKDEKYFPAAYDRAISVAMTTFEDSMVIIPNATSGGSTYNYTVDISAPGISYFATFPNASYSDVGGTSFASPLVAGVVGLTLSHFPTYTPNQAAQRVRITSQNHYAANHPYFEDKIGYGRVDMWNALTAPDMPSVRRTGIQWRDNDGNDLYMPGDTISIGMRFFNYLKATEKLEISLSSPNAANYLEILNPMFLANDINTLTSKNNYTDAFKVVVKPNAPLNFRVDMRISYLDTATNYVDFEYVEFLINPDYINLTENKLYTTVNSRGEWGYNDGPNNTQGLGLSYNHLDNVLFEAGLLIGNSATNLSDNIRKTGGQSADFVTIDRVLEVNAPLVADKVTSARMNDSGNASPVGVEITHKTYSYADLGHQDYIIFEYEVKNTNTSNLNDLYLGLFADLDIADFNNNSCSFNSTEKLVFGRDPQGSDPNYYGMSVLTNDGFKAYATSNGSSFNFSKANKFAALQNTATIGTASLNNTDIYQFISTGPFDITAGASKKIAFAILGGNNVPDLISHNDSALHNYHCWILGEGPMNLFSVDNDTLVKNIPATFADTNTGTTSWTWNFGDGSLPAYTQSVSHAFAQPGTYIVTLYASDGTCTQTFTQTITVLSPVGVEEAQNDFAAYPNPSKGNITLVNAQEQKIQAITLCDLTGKAISAISFAQSSAEIEISLPEVASGVYLLKIQGESKQTTLKVSIVK